MNILGIDPGLDQTGYGVIHQDGSRLSLVEAGFIKTAPRDHLSDRLGTIYHQMCQLIQEHRPGIIAVEELYAHYKHPKTAILMGHARGVMYLTAQLLKVPVVGYNATRVKKVVTGRGHATKDQVAKMVDFHLGITTSQVPVDLTDALAVALTYIFVTAVDHHMQGKLT